MTYMDDHERQIYTIEEVRESGTGFEVHFDDGWVWGGIKKSHGVVPKVGDKLTQWGRGIGYSIRGAMLNEQLLFYRTEEKERLYGDAKARIYKSQKIVDWLDDKDDERSRFEENYESLPSEMKRRIDRFRSNNPEFDWEFGSYEMMCCKQVLALADTIETFAFLADKDAEKVYEDFCELDYSEEGKIFPERDPGHSGNSWGFTRRLTGFWLFHRDMVWAEHGALASLVGCEEFGCPPVDEDELNAA